MKNIPKYILFTLIGALIGSTVTFLIMDNMGTTNKCRVTIKNNQFEPVIEAYETLKNEYYKEIDDSVLIDGMIDGMMEATGDKHTTFFNEEETNNFLTEINGSYYGIGAQIYQTDDEYVTISKIFRDSPAQKSGLQIGDKFVSIDGASMKGKTPDEVSKILRSSESKRATLVVKRGDEEKTIEVEKEIVEIDSVNYEKLEDNIGYIEITSFSSITDNQFTEALSSLEKDNIKSLIIDLRGNGGGYLSTVTNIISRFVDSNTVIYQIKTKKETTSYKALNNSTLNYKVVILIDESSASASEIMCSALQEQYGAILVGKTTYGKGSVQEMKSLSNNTMFKYTNEEWLTSKGNSIEGVGVKPDYEVDLSEEFYSNPVRENDNQLQKAIELLK
jgi:carboxyl-terminal processing protease